MTTWSSDDLAAIAATDDLHIAPFREDGTTYGTPTWIWSVVVDADVYVRAYNGTASRWYLAAVAQRAGRITAAGTVHDVTFEPFDHASGFSIGTPSTRRTGRSTPTARTWRR